MMPETRSRKFRRLTRGIMRPCLQFGSPTLLLVGVAVSPLPAQEDFQSLDLDRPTRLEDAYPLKFREWEFELGTRGSVADSGSAILGLAEVRSGLFLNGEVGLSVRVGAQNLSGESSTGESSGIETVEGHLAYNISRQTWVWPATAFRIDVGTPGTGSLGRIDWGGGVKAMLTRSLSRLRVNGNVGYVVASAADGGDYVQLGLALDYPIGLFSKLLIADIYGEVPTSSGRIRVWAEVGTRWQIGNNSVLDFGIATRLDEWDAGNANLELVLGLSRVFGIPGLMRISAYPEPSIR